ncbi:flagellar FliJ family protein [Nocardioides sp. SYSU DS0663]|uniref:flagellar FliJ family protein n=1 Tax=Nocardioides sp. SYSU DS0663 TaxID=3416445 RepID=UPI003F4BAB9F
MSAHRDRGLKAVARVREVRERDSRLGLQRAVSEHERHEENTAQLEAQLDRAAGADATGAPADVAAYLAGRTHLLGLGRAVGGARRQLDSAAVLRATADSHWQADHTRLSAVEGLLERRDEVRRAELVHEEAKELDDAAGRQWLRRATRTHRTEEERR